jgi:tetratricopeptide (TPR) repeat protein
MGIKKPEYKSAISQFGPDKTDSIFNKPFVQALAIIFIAFLIYSNTFHSPFVLDDLPNITNNSTIKDLDNFWPPSGTRWFGSLTFAINYRLGGMASFGYHFVNLAIHLLNALLVYWLVLLTLKTPYVMSVSRAHGDSQYLAALFSSLVFLSHPIQTQAVTYIVQRFASLATLFYLLTLVMYIKWKESKEQQAKHYASSAMLYAVSLVSAVLAMKTKEIAFTLPVVLCIYEFMFFHGKIMKRTLYLVPFVLTMLIVPLTLTGAGGPLTDISKIGEAATKLSETQGISRLDYLYTQFRVVVTYIRLLFLPINQNLDYDYPIFSSFFTPEVFVSFMFLFSVFALGVYLYRLSLKPETKDRYWLRLMSFGIFWFFVTLSVESSVIPIRDVIFEHRVYLPSVGFFMALTATMGLVVARWGNRVSYAKKVYVMLLVVIVLSAATYARNAVWKDSVSLWEDVVKKSPGKARGHDYLGNAYRKQGRIDESMQQIGAAIAIDPDYAETHNNLGNEYAEQGLFDKAIDEYKIVLHFYPDSAYAHYNLGIVYAKQGRINDAISEFKTALSLNPDYAEVHNNLGIIYAGNGRIDEAIREFKTALNLNPDYVDIHNNLGVIYAGQGRIDEAIREYQNVLSYNPNDIEARKNLEILYGKIKSIEKQP